ncbi:hypothetical protein FQR65_LT12375 [Abscondita terminalis]|nr:hypothetical protein FQR65_LT12375 [Abscondita terminalis]
MNFCSFPFVNETNKSLDDVVTSATDLNTTTAIPETYYLEKDFFYLYFYERVIFFAIYIIVYVVAFFGNIVVIITTMRRKQRYIQKSCLISLSASDFVTATANAVMHLSTFVENIKIWILGSFLCYILPLLPVLGIICSSAALVGIAYDRYQNVVHALKSRWQPTVRQCVVFFSLLWLCSAGISYPMYTYFDIVGINLIRCNNSEHFIEKRYLCVSFLKDRMMVYYISLMCGLFIPMLVIYIWLYIKIAQLVWNHRKPINQKYKQTQSETSSASNSKSTPSNNVKKSPKKESNRVERKLRTFKIIVFLMCIFLILRLPNLIFDTIKLSVVLDSHQAWIIKYICVFLTLLSCALNPFLYTFLNCTINAFKTLEDFAFGVCCFFLSTKEFDELQNGNPFMDKSYEKNTDESDTSRKKSKTSVTFEVIKSIKQPRKY